MAQTNREEKQMAEGGGGGGGGAVVLTVQPTVKKSLVTQLQTKWEEIESAYPGWVSKQSLPVVTATHALEGAALGVLVGSILKNFRPFEGINNIRFQAARDLAVLRGTDEGITRAMKRIRGKNYDTKARAMAGFTSGIMFNVVGNPSTAQNAIATGLVFAIYHGLMHKVVDTSQSPVLDDTCYTRTKCMLSKLGLHKYEKHFKKHLLTDNTMPLLKHSDLKEAEVPLGPRVLILNHIKRDPDIRKMREK